MKEAELVFVLNPAVRTCKKRYILGTDTDAEKLFQELCTRRVYVDGFIDNTMAGTSFFHKPVFSWSGLDINSQETVFLSLNSEKIKREYRLCTEICTINPKLYHRKVMIYGAGYVGKTIYLKLQEKGIEVVGFLDSDEKKSGTTLFGKKVYAKEILSTLPEDICIVEAGKGYYEIDDFVRQSDEKYDRFYTLCLPFEENVIWVDREKNLKIKQWPIVQLGEYCEHEQIKEIILYGNNLALAKKYAEIYACLDFLPVSFMTDEGSEELENVCITEDIIYKESYLILLYEKDEKYFLDKLFALGIDRCYVGTTISATGWNCPRGGWDESVLDVNLGVSHNTNWLYPGIYIYGKNRSEDYKIAVLGGSTTDSMFDKHICSWVEIMYKQYCHASITIFNGAISGYTSSQELIKLIRDIMRLNPNMIIVYDGVNDCPKGSRFRYLESLIEFSGKHIPTTAYERVEKDKIFNGIPSKGNNIDDWLENIKYMYAIAKSKNIDFFSFMQPTLYTKKNLDLHSKTLVQVKTLRNSDTATAAHIFRKRAAEITNTYDYIYDLTFIFDDVDVYMDYAHVYEKGNEIVAGHIWNIIKDVLKSKLGKGEKRIL